MLKVQVSLLLQLLQWGDKAVYQLRAAAQSGGCAGLDAGQLQDSEGDDTRHCRVTSFYKPVAASVQRHHAVMPMPHSAADSEQLQH